MNDTLGWAFAAGYQKALRALVPDLPDGYASFCVTETGGNSPRAIRTTFDARGVLNGKKAFATLGDIATTLLVAAHDPTHTGERPAIAMFLVPASQTVRHTLPATPFCPEIRHAEVVLNDVWGERLPGDGYADYVKPFRTVEDIHVFSALLTFLGKRTPLLEDVRRELQPLEAMDPNAPTTHLLLADLIGRVHAMMPKLDEIFTADPTWRRDKPLFYVAQRARDLRTEKAKKA